MMIMRVMRETWADSMIGDGTFKKKVLMSFVLLGRTGGRALTDNMELVMERAKSWCLYTEEA